jgi:hypothetical protein
MHGPTNLLDLAEKTSAESQELRLALRATAARSKRHRQEVREVIAQARELPMPERLLLLSRPLRPEQKRPAAPTISKRDQEDEQWRMSTWPCPSCHREMRLVGTERSDKQPRRDLLTFQCGCGQIFSTLNDQ